MGDFLYFLFSVLGLFVGGCCAQLEYGASVFFTILGSVVGLGAGTMLGIIACQMCYNLKHGSGQRGH